MKRQTAHKCNNCHHQLTEICFIPGEGQPRPISDKRLFMLNEDGDVVKCSGYVKVMEVGDVVAISHNESLLGMYENIREGREPHERC